MPLRDHFRPPVTDRAFWEALHGAWPVTIVYDLNKRLPARYTASPRVHLGTAFEIDVAATDLYASSAQSGRADDSNGGVATAVWAPPEPTLTIETDLPGQPEYQVSVFDNDRRRVVAAVEFVSPGNKDRPEHRRTFAAKCVANELAHHQLALSIDDVDEDWIELYAIEDAPIAEIKVDRSLVAGCAKNLVKQSVCRRINEFAHSIEVRTVAEGIETRPDLLAAREIGFDMVQGYICGRPVGRNQFASLLRERWCAVPQYANAA